MSWRKVFKVRKGKIRSNFLSLIFILILAGWNVVDFKILKIASIAYRKDMNKIT